MTLNPLFANGEFSGPLGARTHEAKWQALAESLREYGPDKPVAAWKITWRDLKRKARESNAAKRRAASTTGNVPRPIPQINEDDAMVLGVIGVETSEGVGPPESRIGDVEEAFIPPPQSTASPVSSPDPDEDDIYTSLDFTAGPSRTSTFMDLLVRETDGLATEPARHAAPARLTTLARHVIQAPPPISAPHGSPVRPAAPAPAPAPARPALHAHQAAPAAPAPAPAPVHAQAPRTRNQSASFMQLQQEHNAILKDVLQELRKSNNLRALHLEALQEQNRMTKRQLELTAAQLEVTQLIESGEMS